MSAHPYTVWRVVGTLSLLAALCLSPTPSTAQVAPGPNAGRVVLADDFNSNNGWLAPEDSKAALQVGNGRATLVANTTAVDEVSAQRRFLLSPAAAWRISVQVAVSGQKSADAWAGLWLHAPSGEAVVVRLDAAAQDVTISHRRSGQWQPKLLPATSSKAIKSTPGETNTLVVDSAGGRFAVSVNGSLVGTGAVLDFAPDRLQLRASDLKAEFSRFSITETGLDTRQARLLELLPVPGQRTLGHDTLKAAGGIGRALAAVGVGKAREEPEWVKPGNVERTRFERDLGRGRLVLEAKSAEHAAAIYLNSYVPLPGVSFAVSARIHLLRAPAGEDCSGLLVDGKKDAKGEHDMVVACVNAGSLQLLHFDRKTDAWQTLAEADLSVPDPKVVDLRLVVTPKRLIAFVDGRFHASASRPDGFTFDGAGLRVDPNQLIEVSEFKLIEL